MQVQFSHGRPERIGPYRRLFGADLTFDAAVSALLFASSWLRQPIAGADAQTHGVVDRTIREATAKVPMTFAEHVRGVLPHSPPRIRTFGSHGLRLPGSTLRPRLTPPKYPNTSELRR
jgi:hypothetical protein